MDNKRQKLRQTWAMIMMISAFLCFVVSIEAKVWKDEFNDEALNGWMPMGKSFTWEVRDGFLHVMHLEPLQPKQGPILESLQLTAFPGPHQQLTIIATNLKTARSGGFGVALGKFFPDEIGEKRFHYVFFTHQIFARRFSGKDGTSAPFLRWVPTHPGTIWEETREQLKEMKLIFNAGRFQMYANGELRADFEDPHFDQIDVISFVMSSSVVAGAQGWVDLFTISDSALGVEPKGKQMTTWGDMKRRPLFSILVGKKQKR